MADDVRISVSLRRHRKTKRLRRLLGTDGCWSLVCLLLWAGEERWTGDLSGLSDDDIEEEADWAGEPGALIAALVEVRYLDGEAGQRSIHDWLEHNPYAASKGDRIARGKAGAEARWGKKQVKSTKANATSMPQACDPHAASINKHCPPAPAPTPAPTDKAKAKATVAPAVRLPARFDDFWAVYPNKQGKQKAAERWTRDKLDGMADAIIAHVLHMTAHDDGWRRGYAPMGSTYLNQARWTDEARPAPLAATPQPSKTLGGLLALEGMKRGMAANGNHHGVPETPLSLFGPHTGQRAFAGHGECVDGEFTEVELERG